MAISSRRVFHRSGEARGRDDFHRVVGVFLEDIIFQFLYYVVEVFLQGGDYDNGANNVSGPGLFDDDDARGPLEKMSEDTPHRSPHLKVVCVNQVGVDQLDVELDSVRHIFGRCDSADSAVGVVLEHGVTLEEKVPRGLGCVEGGFGVPGYD